MRIKPQITPTTQMACGLIAPNEATDALSLPALSDRAGLEQQIEQRLTDGRGLLGRNVAWSRQLLTKLLDGRITFTPTADEDGKPAYDVEATFTLGRFFSGLLCPKGMASPTGLGKTDRVGGRLRRAA